MRIRAQLKNKLEPRGLNLPHLFSLTCPFARKWKSFLALSHTRSHSNQESRSPLAGSHSIGHKCAPSSVYKCGPLSIFPSVIYTCLLLVSAGGTSQIIPREKTRTKIEMRRLAGEKERKERERKRWWQWGGQRESDQDDSAPERESSFHFNLRDFSLS